MLMFLFLPNQNGSQHDVGKPLQDTYTVKVNVYSTQAKPNKCSKDILVFNGQRLSLLWLCSHTLHMLSKAETHLSHQTLKNYYI